MPANGLESRATMVGRNGFTITLAAAESLGNFRYSLWHYIAYLAICFSNRSNR